MDGTGRRTRKASASHQPSALLLLLLRDRRSCSWLHSHRLYLDAGRLLAFRELMSSAVGRGDLLDGFVISHFVFLPLSFIIEGPDTSKGYACQQNRLQQYSISVYSYRG
jgi:hypothetical protein